MGAYSEPKTFLVIDEETPLLDDIVNILRDENRAVLIANDSGKSLEIINNQKVDFVIMGATTPTETLQTIRTLRKSKTSKNTPMILFSTYYRSPTLHDAVEVTPHMRYLVRPFQKEEFMSSIEELYESMSI